MLPHCFHDRDFFEGSALQLPQAESLRLEEMDRSSKRGMLVGDAGAVIRVLGMAMVYTEDAPP